MLPSWLLIALYLSIGVPALVIAFLKPAWIPVLIVVVMPMYDFDFQLGVTWSLDKIVILLILFALPAHFAIRSRFTARLRIPATVALFLLIVALSTLASYLRLSGGSSGGFGALRGPLLRPEVEFVALLLRVAVLVVVAALAAGKVAAFRLLKAVLFISTIVAAYGVYQFIGYYAGLPILSIYRAQAGLNNYGLFKIGSLTIFRVGSFVGEPKYAARVLFPSLLILVCSRVFPMPELKSWLTSIPVFVLHAVVFILTFATSSFFALALTIPVIAAILAVYPGRRKLSGVASVALGIGLAAAVLVGYAGSKLSSEVVAARVTKRVGSIPPPEKAALEFLQRNPDYLLSGIGLGNASFYLRPYFDPTYHGRPLTIALHSSYLNFVLEGGIFTLVAFLAFLGAWWILGFRLLASNKGAEFNALLATTLLACAGLAVLNAFTPTESSGQIWLFWGLLIALCNECRVWAEGKKPSLAQAQPAANSRSVPLEQLARG